MIGYRAIGELCSHYEGLKDTNSLSVSSLLKNQFPSHISVEKRMENQFISKEGLRLSRDKMRVFPLSGIFVNFLLLQRTQ